VREVLALSLQAVDADEVMLDLRMGKVICRSISEEI
jgi:hypothetical protein